MSKLIIRVRINTKATQTKTVRDASINFLSGFFFSGASTMRLGNFILALNVSKSRNDVKFK